MHGTPSRAPSRFKIFVTCRIHCWPDTVLAPEYGVSRSPAMAASSTLVVSALDRVVGLLLTVVRADLSSASEDEKLFPNEATSPSVVGRGAVEACARSQEKRSIVMSRVIEVCVAGLR